MTNGTLEPSQLAIERFVSRIDADENIPEPIKQLLSTVIPTRDREQIETLRSSLIEWVENDESSKHSAE